MTTHADHGFSITVHTDDAAVLYCLRALADYAQKTGNTRIVWGGTKRDDWERNRKRVTFRFSDPKYRIGFVEEANRILPTNSWSETSRSDTDPAKRQT